MVYRTTCLRVLNFAYLPQFFLYVNLKLPKDSLKCLLSLFLSLVCCDSESGLEMLGSFCHPVTKSVGLLPCSSKMVAKSLDFVVMFLAKM
jgi:hypothetical protein